MRVELINRKEVADFFKEWGKVSRVCYNTPEERAEAVGKSCLENGHYSGSRAFYFKFHISGISRLMSLQLNRHEVGVVKNQASQQFIPQQGFRTIIPAELDDFRERISDIYLRTTVLYEDMINCGVSRNAARYILPEGTITEGVWCFTLEALINFIHKRLCSRASSEIRTLAKELRRVVVEVVPELETKLVPQCEYLLWCPETKSCGRYPSREEVRENSNCRLQEL